MSDDTDISKRRGDVRLERRETLHSGFFDLERFVLSHRMFAGGWSRPLDREVLVRDPVAAVVPYDPVQDAVVLIEQFRAGKYAADDEEPWSVEIVAGIVEAGETPEEMARREAVEEAGCAVTDLERIAAFYPSPGGCSELVTLFCGRTDAIGVGGICGVAEEDEDIRVFVEPLDIALARIAAGRVDNAITIVALQWLAANRVRLRDIWR